MLPQHYMAAGLPAAAFYGLQQPAAMYSAYGNAAAGLEDLAAIQRASGLHTLVGSASHAAAAAAPASAALAALSAAAGPAAAAAAGNAATGLPTAAAVQQAAAAAAGGNVKASASVNQKVQKAIAS